MDQGKSQISFDVLIADFKKITNIVAKGKQKVKF